MVKFLKNDPCCILTSQWKNDDDFLKDRAEKVDVTIPSKLGGYPVTSIGDSAFRNCNSLSSITIPNNVAIIQSNVFRSCYSLSSVTISNSVTIIQNSAFGYCYSLPSITIPNSVTDIISSAFSSCYSLSSVTVPNNVAIIQGSTFYYCYSIKNYILNCTSVPTLSDKNAFDSINKSAIIWVKDDLVESYKSATNWSEYATYIKPISSMPQKLKEELGVL